MIYLYEFLYILGSLFRYSEKSGKTIESCARIFWLKYVWSEWYDSQLVSEDYIRESFMLGKL